MDKKIFLVGLYAHCWMSWSMDSMDLIASYKLWQQPNAGRYYYRIKSIIIPIDKLINICIRHAIGHKFINLIYFSKKDFIDDFWITLMNHKNQARVDIKKYISTHKTFRNYFKFINKLFLVQYCMFLFLYEFILFYLFIYFDTLFH